MEGDPFAWAMNLSKELHRLGQIRSDAIRKRRSDAQNRPDVKTRKSYAMKRFYAEKNVREARQREDDEFARAYVHESCYCHLGNPPCSFCTDSNYCERCNIQTIEETCPRCGEEFDK